MTGETARGNSLIAGAIGIGHFLFDRGPVGTPVVGPRPRSANPWRRDGRALVALVSDEGDLRKDVEKAVSLLGGLQPTVRSGDRVLVKPNFNSSDAYPASTDMEFLKAVCEMLLESGAVVTIGESAGGLWRPTDRVFRKVGLYELAKELGIGITAFEGRRRSDWVKVKIEGDYLSAVSMPRSAYEADKLVYLPCLKTHFLATYSGGLKLAFGFVHPGERRSFHVRRLQEKLAEVNLCWQPDLVIMDARKVFVSGGPNKGRVACPGTIVASGDIVAVDVEGVKLLVQHGAQGLPADPRMHRQIATAVKRGIGDGDPLPVVSRQPGRCRQTVLGPEAAPR